MGASESTPDRSSYESKSSERDPLVSTLTRRRKRKAGSIDDVSDTTQTYKRMKETPDHLPAHLQVCLDYHKTKPWLTKPRLGKVKHTLIAYPYVGTHPPQDLKVFFSNIPYNPIRGSKEEREIRLKGNNYIWYIPTAFLWKAHCYVQHRKGDQITCEADKLVRTFTDKDGNSQSFIFAVVYDDGTFEILTEEHYRKECSWWKEQSSVKGGFGEMLRLLKTQSIDSKEGDEARKIMREKMLDIVKKIDGNTNGVSSLDKAFIQNIKHQGKQTIYDYVENCMRILIFANPDSPLAKYTFPFRKRLSNDYFNTSAIPTLTTEDMFPEYYALSDRKSIEPVRNWINAYLIQEIDDFFNFLVVKLNPGTRKPTKSSYFEDMTESDIPVDIFDKQIKDYCPDKEDTPLEDIVVYRDSDDTVYCFTIEQLQNRDNDTNPIDPSKTIDKEFLYRFDREFKKVKKINKDDKLEVHFEKKYDEDTEEHQCAQCTKYIDSYILRTGSVEKEGEEFKSHLYEFCSSDCLENYKKMEDMFGPITPSGISTDERDFLEKERERLEEENKKLEKKYRKEIDETNRKYDKLQENVVRLESIIKLTETNKVNLEKEKNQLEERVGEKETELKNKEEEFKRLVESIASRVGAEKTMSLSSILSSMDKKKEEREKDINEKKRLENEIVERRKEIDKLKQEVATKNKDIINTTKTAEKYKRDIEEKSMILETAKKEVISALESQQKKYNELLEKLHVLELQKKDLDNKVQSLEKSEREKDIDLSEKLKEKEQELRLKLEEAVNECKTSSKKEEREKQRLEERVSVLQGLIETEKKIKENLQVEIKSRDRAITELSEKINMLEDQVVGIPQLKQQIDELTQANAAAPSAAAKIQIDELKTKLLMLNAQAREKADLKTQLSTIKAELDDFKTKESLCASKETTEEMKTRMKEMQSIIDRKGSIISQLEASILGLKKDKASCRKKEDIDSQIEELRTSHSIEMDKKEEEHQRQLKALQDEYDEKLKNVKVVERVDTSAIEEEIKSKYDKLLEEQQANLQKQYGTEMESLRKEIGIVQSRLENVQREKEEVDKQLANTSKNESDAIISLEREKKELKEQVEKEKRKLEELNDKFKQTVEKLNSDIKEAETKCNEACDEKCSTIKKEEVKEGPKRYYKELGSNKLREEKKEKVEIVVEDSDDESTSSTEKEPKKKVDIVVEDSDDDIVSTMKEIKKKLSSI